MKTIPEGHEGRLSVVVTDDMLVDFVDLGRIHPVYSTYSLAKHMEEAGRKIIVPFLEPHEEGIGSAVSVRHLAPALPGMRVEVVAVYERTEGSRVYVSCRAWSEIGDAIGTGETEQVVLPRDLVQKRFDEVARRWSAR